MLIRGLMIVYHFRLLVGIRNGFTSFFFFAGGLTMDPGGLLGKLETDVDSGSASLLLVQSPI